MSKRPQVLRPEPERETSKEEVRANHPAVAPETKLAAVRLGLRYNFPSGDIAEMVEEIEQGYLG